MLKINKLFPFLKWGKSQNRKSIKADAIAGIIGAIIILPQGVAFATIAGLPPEYGLYSAIVPAIIAALWGSSNHLVSGPTTAISLVIFTSISPLAPVASAEYVKLVLTLAFLVGIIEIVMGLMKVGKLLDFISHTVIVGFTAGAGILIISSQIKNFFGIDVSQGTSFYETICIFISEINEINYYVLCVSATTLLVGILMKKIWPKFPYMIFAMIIGSLTGFFLNHRYGVDITGIKTVGALPSTLPPFSMPSFNPEIIKKIASPALAITMLALTEAIAISRAVALRSGQKIDGNQEVVGQGMSNIIGSFFSAYPASGSFNRSGLNYASGAKTPMASIFAAIFLAIIIIFVAPLATYLPIAVMAGILFLVAWGIIDFRHIKGIIKSSKGETGLLIITFLSTLFFNLEFAIIIGVFFSIALYLNYTSRPVVEYLLPNKDHSNRKFVVSPRIPSCSQFAVMRIDGPIFFGSVSNIEKEMNDICKTVACPKNILIIFTGVNIIDLAGIDMLRGIIKSYRSSGGDVFLSSLNSFVVEKFEKSNFFDVIGRGNVFTSKADAIRHIILKSDRKNCEMCKNKIFNECS